MKAALFLALLLTLCACSTLREPYTIGHSGQTVSIGRGSTFEVRLLSNISTGGTWRVTEIDEAVVAQTGSVKPQAIAVAGGLPRLYSYTFRFKGVQKGNGNLRIDLMMPNNPEPGDTFSMNVVVR